MHNESCIIFYYMCWFSTLAFLYGVETKALNQAVKRNTNRFPEDFLFKLTKNEPDILRSQIVTSNLNNNHGLDILISQNATSSFAKMGLRRPPYAFTLQRCNHGCIARDIFRDVEMTNGVKVITKQYGDS